MLPLADIHCHLLAGLDDGPATQEEALEMCRIAYAEGVRTISALAHQNETYPDNTPARIRAACQLLAQHLREAQLALNVFPSAEIMLRPDLEAAWKADELLSVADRRQYLFLEFPHGVFFELAPLIARLRQTGVRPILAHAERVPELLLDPGRIESWIEAGCLIQVNSGSITRPRSAAEAREVKSWVQRGIVHAVSSDGHSPRHRPPHMAAAYREIEHWAGPTVADRVCSSNGLAIAAGLPLYVPPPAPRPGGWFARLRSLDFS